MQLISTLRKLEPKQKQPNRNRPAKSLSTHLDSSNTRRQRLLEYFWQGIIILIIAFTGLDRMMTGIIKPDIEKQAFLTYALWFILTNQAVA